MTLKDLPPDHPDRNRPLVGMFNRSRGSKLWYEVMPAFGIANKTYNQLAACWTTWDDWAVEKPL